MLPITSPASFATCWNNQFTKDLTLSVLTWKMSQKNSWLNYDAPHGLSCLFSEGWDLEQNHCYHCSQSAYLQINSAKKSQDLKICTLRDTWILDKSIVARFEWWEDSTRTVSAFSFFNYCQTPKAVNPEVLNLSQVTLNPIFHLPTFLKY